MASGFHRASLSISLDFDFEQFRSGDTRVHRVYWHEKFHFYQALSQGYVTRLALLEWQHLNVFAETGEITPADELNTYLSNFFAPHPVGRFAPPEFRGGISAWNLSEALTRFWDIHAMGFETIAKELGRNRRLPRYLREIRRQRPKDIDSWVISDAEFDYLMSAEDWYAGPYRLFLSHSWSSRMAALLFPLVAHFALQSLSPVAVFALASDRLPDDPELVIRLQAMQQGAGMVPPIGPWNSFTMGLWWPVVAARVQRVCDDAAREINSGVGLEAGWDVIARTSLRDHPVYSFMLSLLDPVVHISSQAEFAAALPGYPPLPLGTAFALPGSPAAMAILKDLVQPPVVVFNDRIWYVWENFGTGDYVRSASVSLSKICMDIRQLQRAVDRAKALAALTSTAAGARVKRKNATPLKPQFS
jgi:hypothetical protein